MAKRKAKAKPRKSKKARKANGKHEAVSVGANFKKAVKDYIGRIENLQGDLESERGKYMRACQPIKDDIAELYAEAKGEGISPKALKAEVRIRKLDRDKDAAREKLSTEDQDELDKIRLALGELADTPLGTAALNNVVPIHPAETAEPAAEPTAETNEPAA